MVGNLKLGSTLVLEMWVLGAIPRSGANYPTHVKKVSKVANRGVSHCGMRKCRGLDTRKSIQVIPVLEYAIQSADSEEQDLYDFSATNTPIGDGTTVFADASSDNRLDISKISDAKLLVKASKNTELGAFLGRPTKIASGVWSTSDNVGSLSFTTPWYDFLNNPVIKNKISNFAFFRGTLCIKVVINGTKFHYGSLRVCYQPLHRNYLNRFNFTGTGAGFASLVAYDQLPGEYVVPTDNTGVELKLPMIYNREFMPLKFANDAQSMGLLRYVVYAPLRVANTGASTSVSYTTYAWMEDVELSGSSNELVLQSKDEYDEAGGPVSAPAMSLANVARSLSHVPVIGRFAKATEMGASAVGNIAKLFGFTNVPNIQDVPPMVPTAGPHLATSQISVPFQPLNLQPKAQISIDPKLHGLPSDDALNIQKICSKRCYFASTSWAVSDTPGTVLWNSVVNPANSLSVAQESGSPATTKGFAIQHTPMSFCSQFFTDWRGDLIFTIKLIKSKFHSGRLRLTWDPMGTGGTTAPPENSVYNTIIDLSEKDEYEVRIPWFYQTNYAYCREQTDTTWTLGNSLSSDPDKDNGLLTLSVLNTLAAPLSTAAVQIIVYARAAENFQLNNPRDSIGNVSLFEIQSKDERDQVHFEDPNGSNAEVIMKHYGAPVNSLRELVRRSRLYDSQVINDASATRAFWWAKSFPMQPYSYGYDPLGYSQANRLIGTGSTNFTYCSAQNIIPLINACFVGVTGSYNYTFVWDSGNTQAGDSIRVYRANTSRTSGAANGVTDTNINVGDTPSSMRRSMQRWTGLGNGGALLVNRVNNVLQVNVPYLNKFSFMSPDPGNAFRIGPPEYVADGLERQSVNFAALLKQSSANETAYPSSLTTYLAAGPDYQVLQWVFPATCWIYSSNPAAA